MHEQRTDQLVEMVDVVVIGGGPAGLSAALTLGRSRRSVVVVDSGQPRNATAGGVHNYLTRDGTPPTELLDAGRAEVDHYGGHRLVGTAVSARRVDDGFEVTLADGAVLGARRLLVTSGLIDELPAVPGLRERWGHDVIHCPYCHGWEVRDRPIGVLASSPMSVHQALLFRQWTSDLVLFQHTAPPVAAEESEQLAARGIRVVSGEVERVETIDGRLSGVRMSDGSVIPREVVVVAPRMVARSTILASLGLEPVPHALGAEVGEYYPADAMGATQVPGVWVAGNVADLQAVVIGAAAQAVRVAAMINADLVAEETREAVEAAREVERPAPVPS